MLLVAGPDLDYGRRVALFASGPVALHDAGHVVVRAIHLSDLMSALPQVVTRLLRVADRGVNVLEGIVLVCLLVTGKGHAHVPMLGVELGHNDLLNVGA
jgi:hypothetical protein